MMMYEWLIIGGGIQGCTMATYLLRNRKTSIENIAIIDPHHKPLSTWLRCTSTLEMPFLRSPSIHHIDVDPFALEKFVNSSIGKYLNKFTLPYNRPSLELFNEHCHQVFEETQLRNCWIQGRVIGMGRIRNGWKVVLADGQEMTSQHVVLAMGLSEHPFYPEWAKHVQSQKGHITHVFDKNISDFNETQRPIVVIGGGISAAHISLRLSYLFPGEVTLLTRHSFRVHQFDSDPGWLGPKNMSSFRQVKDHNERRKVIQKARYRGSIPQELRRALIRAQQRGCLTILTDEVRGTSVRNRQTMLLLESEQEILTGSIVLATGFHSTVPGIEWLQSVVHSEGLSCAKCGYPIVSPNNLEWGPNLFVIGALAELEIGPVSRNIAGARRGAERILRVN
jgi:hypothetical protein